MEKIAIVSLLAVGIIALTVSFFVSRNLARRLAEADRERTVMTHQVIETGRLASIGELAAGIAHEINNPVAIMVQEAGWIDDLLHDDDTTSSENLEEIDRAVRQIRTQGDRCKEITYKLLSFARKTDPTVREVVLRHGVAYVDLFSFIASLDLPGSDCREPGPDDGVRFPYPLGPAMDAIADEVLSR